MSENMSEKTEELQEENAQQAENAGAEALDPGAVYESAADSPQATQDTGELSGDTVGDTVGDAAGTADGETVGEIDMVANLREQLAASEAKANDYLDRLQRTAAEFQNSRRRQERQLADEIERANGALIQRLLPVLDDFDLAFQNVPLKLEVDAQSTEEQVQLAWIEGFRQIHKKLMDILADEGVAPIEVFGPFDPMVHEAVASVPSEDVPSGFIVDVMRAGYTYKGKVLRPALVRVAL